LNDSAARLQTALADRYHIERELGRGGMATVYLAQDLHQDRLVALKIIHPELAATLGPDRFLREIKLTAKLRHPHILPLFDSGEAAGQLWYTMPYVEGESLRQRLVRGKRLPVEEALRLAGDVLAALAYAHEHGIVHRDIKPENILLEGDEAVLADFGIAQAVSAAGSERLTKTGVAVGTLAYMSPEQASGQKEIDGRSDLYSLGCVLYESICGEPPFTGPTPQAIITKHLTMPPPMITTADGTVPTTVAQALDKALAKTPDERFDNAAAFAKALGIGREVRTLRVARRRTAILVLLAIAVLGLTFYAGRRIASGPPERGGSVASGFNRKLTQLTFGEGLEEWPAWSPDGSHLAYVAEVDGFRQLFVRSLATGAERRLSREQRDDIQPAWSPEGRRLAFVRARTSRGKLEPSDINGWYPEGGDIWMLDLESRREAKLVEDAFNPTYSPDGGRLAFDAPLAGARRIWIADASGRNPRQVTSDSSEAVVHTGPRWSPDGSKLAFRRIDKIKSDIVVVDPVSQAVARVTNDNVLDMDPVWAPDARHLYFASSRGGGLNLWRIKVGSGGRPAGPPEQLTTGAGDDVEPTVAPDGGRLAFAVRGINSDLWRLPVAPTTAWPTGAPEPAARTTRVESRGAWSPDGRTIAFNSDRLGEMNIWLHGMADSAERQLTKGPGGDYQPNWSPNGRSIAFFSAREGNADIWAVRVSDGRLSRLTSDPATDTNPFYSPDGRRIAFLSDRGGRSEVWVMQADGSKPRRLTTVGAGGHFLRWTRDGSGIVFRAESGTQIQVYRVSVEDGSLTRLPDINSGAHMSFSPAQSLILDVRGHKSLWVYPVSGQAGYQVFAFSDPDVRIDYPAWSPDGRWVLFDRAAPRGGDLWLLEGIN
jgi:Tol biopolymer transport system component/tRNA A-37 threonylcarbamoyl transferase component Bud32